VGFRLGEIKGTVMGENIKGDHFKLVKDMDKDMEDFIVEFFTNSSSED